jgi:hypothetical protein
MTRDGRALVVLGISDDNIARLQGGDAMYFDPARLRLDPETTIGAIVLVYGNTEAELTDTMQSLLGSDIDVSVMPLAHVVDMKKPN